MQPSTVQSSDIPGSKAALVSPALQLILVLVASLLQSMQLLLLHVTEQKEIHKNIHYERRIRHSA